MKQAIMHAFGFLTAAFLLASAGPARADAVGPYYATPSWDQQLPGSTRLVVLSNWIDANFPAGGAAVLDRETGLVWERSPSSTQLTWNPVNPAFQTALAYCNQRTVGNRWGWRLPTLQELDSLLDPTAVSQPMLPSGHPFTNVGLGPYWTASTDAADTTQAWIVNFGFGNIGPTGKSGLLARAWCVRGGQGVDPQ
jgi:hypothetical protein